MGVAIIVAVSVVVIGAAVYYALKALKRRHSEVKSVITEFMEAGAAKNVEAAYACCSPHSFTKERIAELIKSSYDVFAGYERLSIKSLGTRSVSGISDVIDITDVFEGTKVTEGDVGGAIIYTGGKKLPFTAQLVRENYIWKITGIQIGSTEMMGIVRSLSISIGGPPGPG